MEVHEVSVLSYGCGHNQRISEIITGHSHVFFFNQVVESG
jgi:hypothetical protein